MLGPSASGVGLLILRDSVTAARLLQPIRRLTLAGRIDALASGVAIAIIGSTAFKRIQLGYLGRMRWELVIVHKECPSGW